MLKWKDEIKQRHAARNATRFERGFETRRVLLTELTMRSRPTERRDWGAFHRALADRLSALQAVQAVAYSYRYPFRDSITTAVQSPGEALRRVEINPVSSNYFTTLGIEIVNGRALQEGDPPCEQSGGCSVVVSEQLARAFWAGESPLGQTLRDSAGHVFEVVGVARDISSMRLGGLDDATIYQPANLNGTSRAHPFVRFSGDEAALARGVPTAARELAPELSVGARTIQSVREDGMERLGRYTQLVAVLCAMAVMLAVLGIYGVVGIAVSQRTKEMGIRIALGAQKKDIYQAILGSSGRPIVIGLVIGLLLTVAAWRGLAPLLQNAGLTFNVRDPISYMLTAVLLAGVALSAMLVPARRATCADPLQALRDE